MKSEKISDALSRIDEELLAEANEVRKRRNRKNIVRPIIALAAAAAVIVAGMIIVPRILDRRQETDPADEGSKEQTTQNTRITASSEQEETTTEEPASEKSAEEQAEIIKTAILKMAEESEELCFTLFTEGKETASYLVGTRKDGSERGMQGSNTGNGVMVTMVRAFLEQLAGEKGRDLKILEGFQKPLSGQYFTIRGSEAELCFYENMDMVNLYMTGNEESYCFSLLPSEVESAGNSLDLYTLYRMELFDELEYDEVCHQRSLETTKLDIADVGVIEISGEGSFDPFRIRIPADILQREEEVVWWLNNVWHTQYQAYEEDDTLLKVSPGSSYELKFHDLTLTLPKTMRKDSLGSFGVYAEEILVPGNEAAKLRYQTSAMIPWEEVPEEERTANDIPEDGYGGWYRKSALCIMKQDGYYELDPLDLAANDHPSFEDYGLYPESRAAMPEEYYALLDLFMEHKDELLVKRFAVQEGEESVSSKPAGNIGNLTFYLNTLKLIETELTALYEVSDDDVFFYDTAVLLTYKGSKEWFIMYEDSDVLQIHTEKGDRYYLLSHTLMSGLPGSVLIRNIYDDAEMRECQIQTGVFDPVPDTGQTYIDAASEWLRRDAEAVSMLDPENKSYCSFLTWRVEPVDDWMNIITDDITGLEEGAFSATFIWKVETQRAFMSRAGGANIPYNEYIELSGEIPDPTVPEGAYIGTVYGRVSKDEEGWHVEIIGTSLN